MNIKTKFYLLIVTILSLGSFSCKKDNTITTPVLSEFAKPTLLENILLRMIQIRCLKYLLELQPFPINREQ